MTTSFPTSLDNFTNPTASDTLNSTTVPHPDQHANANDAIEALEAKVGINGSAVATSLDYRVTALEAITPMLDAGTSTDNAVVRFNGTDGQTTQNSALIVGDNGEIHGYRGSRNAQTGTTYEIVSGDSGKVLTLTNGSPITCTISNDVPVDFVCTVIQGGAGQITFTAESGGTQRNRQSHTKSAGQWGVCGIYVFANSGGSAAEYILSGDTAT